MRWLKIFEGKPLKRIELKAHSQNSKVRLRASRTGGINAAYHPVRGITLNTKNIAIFHRILKETQKSSICVITTQS